MDIKELDVAYVQRVTQELRQKPMLTLAFGTVRAEVQVVGGKAVLAQRSSNREFNEAVEAAANKALAHGSVPNGLRFPVHYTAPYGAGYQYGLR